MIIGYIGNFEAPHSTENDRAWSFNRLGHQVVAFQENKITVSELSDYTSHNKIDLMIYSHTHGWEIEGLEGYLKGLSLRGIPTCSIHLDLWTGLEREKDLGNESTWKCDYVFTPDKSINLPNHHYLRPGIKETSCYLAAPDPVKYHGIDVAFVGSYGYHKEYPERPALIDFLKKEYGVRFLHIEHSMRGHDLNVLYRSVPVIVGDSCFSQSKQIPGYYSDRVPETTGRGGLLLHPYTKAIENPGVVMWNDYTDLKSKIKEYLEYGIKSNGKRLQSFEYTKEHDTYTIIAKEVLDVVRNGSL